MFKPLFDAISAIIGFLSESTARVGVFKSALVSTMLFAIPAMMYQVMSTVCGFAIQYIQSSLSSLNSSLTVLQIAGLAGYLANNLRVPEIIGVSISAVLIRFVLKLIPVVRVGS